MSNLVIITGDFSSGSTLLFTLFRQTKEYYCLYEPLHEKLLEYLIWRLRVEEHHFFLENYFSEYKGFRKIPKLFKPEWGNSNLYLSPTEDADDLYRYLTYLTGTAFGRAEKVMLKENRLPFRLGWIRAKFPHAKIVHVYREKQSQWNSIVRRVQAYHGREDVGQQSVNFTGFNVARWCDDIKHVYPELDAKNFENGYDRFCKLWELSYAENKHYSDISVDYWVLTHDFNNTFEQIKSCIGGNFDVSSLSHLIIPKEKQKQLAIERSGIKHQMIKTFEKSGRKYARARLLARSLWMQK